MANLLNLNELGVAIGGYDPVSYFEGDSPNPGNPELSSCQDGANYYFANAENKAKFDADPAAYIPQYGGFCAVAVSEGKTFPVDPKTYKVTDNKLFLFYNGELGNTKSQWEEDEAARKVNADNHWAKQDLISG